VNRVLIVVAIVCALATLVSSLALVSVLGREPSSAAAGTDVNLVCASYEVDGRLALVCYRHPRAQQAEEE
jgi:hypothetical protein